MERRDDMRAGDSDRQLVADRLREALNEGRLSIYEFDDRVKQAYGAKTFGDLNGLLDDLPPVVPEHKSQVATTSGASSPAPAGEPRHGLTSTRLAQIWGSWSTTTVIVTGIWIATAWGTWSWQNFWPVWVIVPWGAVCLAATLRVLIGGEEGRREHDRRHEERRQERQRRKDRKWH